MQTFDSKLVTTGALNFLTYCFRAKNYYGMVDKTEVVHRASKPAWTRSVAGGTERKVQGHHG